MSAFSTWARRLKSHLYSAGVSIPLGQAQELLASGLGHNTRASFQATEAELLPRAHHVVFLVSAVHARADALGIDLSPVRSLREILDILGEPDGELAPDGVYYLGPPQSSGPITEDSFEGRVFSLVEACDHVLHREIAEELGGDRAKTVAHQVEDAVPLASAGKAWAWTFSGYTRLADESTGWHVPVSGALILPRIGRTLLGPPSMVRLERTGTAQPYDDEADQGDVYGYDGSD